ncbi:MFS transporter [Aminobacter sp. MSH1]|uniref:MFS transporter n=1 Tax=Aminobacter sp. MSH1 TaxID=374606 RepID=UPI001901C418|nr:MFS transporter [Aminobacter sp. MSH1]
MLAFRQKQLSAPGDGLHGRQRAIATCAVLLNVCMANLDTAIANTALPTIARDLNTTEAQSIWIVGAYQLAMVASLLPAAALGEIVGLRRISMGGLVLFTLASLVCGLAPSLEWLVAGRVVQGVSAAGILGTGVAMMRFIYPHALLGRGMGLNALVVGLSFAAGPSVASAVLSLTSWHWLFLMKVPLGLIGIVMGLYALPPTIRSARRFDGWAAALCALFLATTVFALNTAAQGASWGTVATNATIAITSLAVLLKRQANRPAPILVIDLLRKPIFALSSVASFFTMITQALAFVSLPFLFQLLGYTQVETGFLITPWPALLAFSAPLAGHLSDRIPAGLLGGVGLAVLSLGMLLLAAMPPEPDALDVAWRMAVCGAGFGFFQSPNMRTMITSVPPERSGGAGGMSSVIGNLGQACGVAIVAALFNLFGAHGAVIALWLGAAFALLGSGASFVRLRYRPAMGLEPLKTLQDRASS